MGFSFISKRCFSSVVSVVLVWVLVAASCGLSVLFQFVVPGVGFSSRLLWALGSGAVSLCRQFVYECFYFLMKFQFGKKKKNRF